MAQSTCESIGGNLVSIHSAEEYDFVATILTKHLPCAVAVEPFCENFPAWYAWIGLSDASREGTYVWSDGTAFDYTDRLGASAGGGEDCFVLSAASTAVQPSQVGANDLGCSGSSLGGRLGKKGFVCKITSP